MCLFRGRYVRVVGMYNSMNKTFHLVSFACLYTFKPFKLTKRDIIGEGIVSRECAVDFNSVNC